MQSTSSIQTMMSSREQTNRQCRHRRSGPQRGAAALVLAALMVVFCTTLAGTYYLASRDAFSVIGDEQSASLRWAQEAVTGFAMANGRLPCAAAVRDGAESCATGTGKGWLPVATIEQFAHAAAARGRMHVRYMVYRGTGGGPDVDLASADDAFKPTLTDGSIPAGYPAVVSSVDLCGKLRAASLPSAGDRWAAGPGPTGDTARTDRANVKSASGGGVANVAYAVAVSPTGTADDQSGANAAAGPSMESPYRTAGPTYRAAVRAVDFASLYEKLSCAMAAASLDGIAVAANWTVDSVAMRKGTIEGSAKIAEIEELVVTSAWVGVSSSALDLRSASINAAKAAALVATNTPLLPEPTAVVAVASGTAGTVTAATTLSMAKIDLERGVVGAAVETGNLVAYRIAEKIGKDSHVWVDSTAVLRVADTLGTAP